jgi:hypothetical protein
MPTQGTTVASTAITVTRHTGPQAMCLHSTPIIASRSDALALIEWPGLVTGSGAADRRDRANPCYGWELNTRARCGRVAKVLFGIFLVIAVVVFLLVLLGVSLVL